MQYTRVKALVHKEFLQDWKEKNSLASILVYVTSTVFVCYLAFQQIVNAKTYVALFWIIILFTSVNTIIKSFAQDTDNRLLYYYSIANPKEIILSKIIYNTAILLGITIITFGIYATLLGNPAANLAGFTFTIILGSVGLSVVFTLMAAIASKSNNNPALMAILSFPVILPFLITLIALSLNFAQGVSNENNFRYFMSLGGIIVIGITMAYLLFPYLWRD